MVSKKFVEMFNDFFMMMFELNLKYEMIKRINVVCTSEDVGTRRLVALVVE